MKGWNNLSGIAVTILRNDIDTDQLLPKQFMKLIDKSQFGKYLFYHWRFQDHGGEHLNADFILNQMAHLKPCILITGKNFGCGSSREHAAWALSDFGFRVIIGQSFGDIFSINAANNGIALIRLPESSILEIERWWVENKDKSLKVDLNEKKVLFGTEFISFEMEDSVRNRILTGRDEIATTLESGLRISAFVESYLKMHPYLNLNA